VVLVVVVVVVVAGARRAVVRFGPKILVFIEGRAVVLVVRVVRGALRRMIGMLDDIDLSIDKV
jgi:hypothetical protein